MLRAHGDRGNRSRPKEFPMKTRLFAATVVALIPLASLAAEPQKTPDPATPAGQSASFDTLDANKDGRISMPEASADPRLVESFSTADKDGDGYLDAAEYDNSTENPPQQ
jgi:EF hand domain-containing protein